jgi:hypothetical protein
MLDAILAEEEEANNRTDAAGAGAAGAAGAGSGGGGGGGSEGQASEGGAAGGGPGGGGVAKAHKVGLYKLSSVVTHSLKAPGFCNP